MQTESRKHHAKQEEAAPEGQFLGRLLGQEARADARSTASQWHHPRMWQRCGGLLDTTLQLSPLAHGLVGRRAWPEACLPERQAAQTAQALISKSRFKEA